MWCDNFQSNGWVGIATMDSVCTVSTNRISGCPIASYVAPLIHSRVLWRNTVRVRLLPFGIDLVAKLRKSNVFTSVCQAFCPHGGGGAWVAGQTATSADGTHPTRMHSCFKWHIDSVNLEHSGYNKSDLFIYTAELHRIFMQIVCCSHQSLSQSHILYIQKSFN